MWNNSGIKTNSWTNEAKKTRGTMTPRCVLREENKVLEREVFENKNPVYVRILVEEGHLGLKAESRCSTKKHLASYGLQEVELQQKGARLDAAGALYVPLAEYKNDTSIDTLGDKINTLGEKSPSRK